MPENRALPLFRWGEEMRRRRDHARADRFRSLRASLAGAAVAGLCLTLVWRPVPRLVWNGSASSPSGLYSLSPGRAPGRGEMVVAWPPSPARRLAAERGYLPATVPLVKRVAAAGGDRVCAIGEALFVDGRLTALRRRSDLAGRPLLWWTDCLELRAGQLLLLGDSPNSFDGRYFGVTEPAEVIAPAKLQWRR